MLLVDGRSRRLLGHRSSQTEGLHRSEEILNGRRQNYHDGQAEVSRVLPGKILRVFPEQSLLPEREQTPHRILQERLQGMYALLHGNDA